MYVRAWGRIILNWKDVGSYMSITSSIFFILYFGVCLMFCCYCTQGPYHIQLFFQNSLIGCWTFLWSNISRFRHGTRITSPNQWVKKRKLNLLISWLNKAYVYEEGASISIAQHIPPCWKTQKLIAFHPKNLRGSFLELILWID